MVLVRIYEILNSFDVLNIELNGKFEKSNFEWTCVMKNHLR